MQAIRACAAAARCENEGSSYSSLVGNLGRRLGRWRRDDVRWDYWSARCSGLNEWYGDIILVFHGMNGTGISCEGPAHLR